MAPKTLLLELRTLQAAFNLAQKLEQVQANPLQRALAMELIEVECNSRECFSAEQVAALVKAADGDWKTLVLLGYFTGARVSDCANLRWDKVS